MVSIDKACFLMFNTRLVILQPHPIPRIEQVGHILLLYYSILLLLMLLYSAVAYVTLFCYYSALLPLPSGGLYNMRA